ncbi:glutathione S-transferase N-terminal domain-containing protein [Chelatococcus sp. SYSU_G07232]|uniref:Glutathione S-transferase N-terminal domain-containing protein n=1 Tax=Chelatococcus albus TaxID=3047466 RepID=A0ABT7AI42_9HYPH|nr:glutathione S-transferase N-terminal domain-containing protein [Chelatococcus sp. SYSU_G07232]MDJ1158454.1 glutathione S-transferase N-terminal domain-containing protein [Chelatococcus sp. SYSU_G07232]
MLTLYFAPGACSMAPHIALEEVGATFEPKGLSLRKGQHREPRYLAVNPRGKVPALLVDGDLLTENVAIFSYLDAAFPQAGLLPQEPLARAQALSWLAWLTSGVHPAFSPLFGPQRYVDGAEAQASLVAKSRTAVTEKLAEIDRLLAGRDYALGTFSAVDCYLYPFFHWAKAMLGFDVSPYANYAAHHARMQARPSVQRMLAREAAVQAELDKAA